MTKRQTSTGVSSRDKFLSAADEIYVRNGYDGTTIRAITAEAGTSLAALHRHWTGKRHLFKDVFTRHFDPIHAAQNLGFDKLEARDGPVSPLVDVLEAFIAPALSGAAPESEGHIGHRVYCRALTDSSSEASLIIGPLIEQVRARLLGKLKVSLRPIDEEDFFLATTIMLGAYTYSQVNGRRLAGAMSLSYDQISWAGAGRRLAELLADGLSQHASRD